MINYIPPVQKEVKLGESVMSHDSFMSALQKVNPELASAMNNDIFMTALQEVDPELTSAVNFLKDQNSDDDRVKTFEDCARVEQDIMSRLNSANPFQ